MSVAILLREFESMSMSNDEGVDAVESAIKRASRGSLTGLAIVLCLGVTAWNQQQHVLYEPVRLCTELLNTMIRQITGRVKLKSKSSDTLLRWSSDWWGP